MQFRSKTQKFIFLSLLAATAIVLSYMERMIPFPFFLPGMKLGLANIITLSALYYYDFKDVLVVVLVRVFVTFLIVGQAMSLIYSLSGGVLSLLGMYLLIKFASKWVSPIGVSIFGAFLHNVAQLIVLAIIMNSVSISINYGPYILLTSIGTGFFVGITSNIFIERIFPEVMRNNHIGS